MSCAARSLQVCDCLDLPNLDPITPVPDRYLTIVKNRLIWKEVKGRSEEEGEERGEEEV